MNIIIWYCRYWNKKETDEKNIEDENLKTVRKNMRRYLYADFQELSHTIKIRRIVFRRFRIRKNYKKLSFSLRRFSRNLGLSHIAMNFNG